MATFTVYKLQVAFSSNLLESYFTDQTAATSTKDFISKLLDVLDRSEAQVSVIPVTVSGTTPSPRTP